MKVTYTVITSKTEQEAILKEMAQFIVEMTLEHAEAETSAAAA